MDYQGLFDFRRRYNYCYVYCKDKVSINTEQTINLFNDEDGNAVVGDDVRLFHCHGCVVHLPSVKTAVLEGLDGYVVAEKNGALLVCRLSDEQHIKQYSEKRTE